MNSYRAMTSQLNSLNKELDAHQKELEKADAQHGKAAKSTAAFMSVIKAAVTGYVGKSFLEATIGGTAQFEQYETSFAVMLGDMQSAKSLMAELQDFAAKTPFQLPDVTDAAQLLMNYGVEAENIIETMTRLGDLSQGQAEKLDRVALAYGQMLAKGKVTGEELRQMTEAGVPLTQALADSIGTTTAELSKMIEKGQVGIPQLDAAIESLTTGTGKFAGMMQKQSETLVGQWSTFKDEIGQTAREIGEGAAGELKTGLSEVRKELDKMRQNGELTKMGKNIGAVMSTTVKVLSFATKAVIEHKDAVKAVLIAYASFKVIQQTAVAVRAYKDAVAASTAATKAMTVAQGAMNAVASVNPYIALATILASVIGVIMAFSSATDEAKKRTKELNEELVNFETTSVEGAAGELAELRVAAEQTVPRIEELGAKAGKTAGEKQLLKQYIEELNTTLGYEAAAFNEVTGKLTMNTDEVYRNIEALEARARAQAMQEKLVEKEKELIEIEMQIAEAKAKPEKAASMRNRPLDVESDPISGEDFDFSITDWLADLPEWEKQMESINTYIDMLGSEISEAEKEIINAGTSMDGFWSSVSSGNSAIGEAISSIKALSDNMSVLRAVQEEYNDTGAVSASSLESLSKAYPELAEKVDEYAAGLIDLSELMQDLPAVYEADKTVYANSMKSKLQTSGKFYRQEILSQMVLVDQYKSNYGIDLKNFTSLAQAKGEIEQNLIKVLGESWSAYYREVGGSATLTASKMQEQLAQLKKMQESPLIARDENAKTNIKNQILEIESMLRFMEPMKDLENIEVNVDFSSITANFDAMTKDVEKSASSTAKKVNDVLKESYNEQLKIAKEYYSEQKKQAETRYKEQVEAIQNAAKAETDALNARYEREKNDIQSAIDEIDRLIAAKKRAREEEKLDDELAFTKKRVETLETQISYARSPEEAEELKKELARQQEALKDLNVQVEVNALEQQKQAHEDKLSQIEEEHKAQLAYIEERRDAELAALEVAQKQTLTDLEVTFNQFSDNLAATYGYVNNETLAIGQRFANATTGALESGFTVVARKAQEQIDSMVAQVEDAIYRMEEAYANTVWAYKQGREQERGYSYNYSDGRSMQVTNNITRGLTEGQVSRMLDRQAERFLYGRR